MKTSIIFFSVLTVVLGVHAAPAHNERRSGVVGNLAQESGLHSGPGSTNIKKDDPKNLAQWPPKNGHSPEEEKKILEKLESLSGLTKGHGARPGQTHNHNGGGVSGRKPLQGHNKKVSTGRPKQRVKQTSTKANLKGKGGTGKWKPSGSTNRAVRGPNAAKRLTRH